MKKPPKNALNLAGKTFGKLTVIERAGRTANDNALWRCECECGETTTANATSLRRGDTVSCGCLKVDQAANARRVLREDKTVDGVQVPYLTKRVRSDSVSGHKGVTKRTRQGKVRYEAYITVQGKRKYLGSSVHLNVAIAMRKKAEETYHKPYIDALAEAEKGTPDQPATKTRRN